MSSDYSELVSELDAMGRDINKQNELLESIKNELRAIANGVSD